MKLVRKLILSSIALGMLAATTVTSSLAWFQINGNTQVEGIEFQAISGLGFLVSVDGVNYKNDLTTSDIVKAMLHAKNPKYQFDTEGNLWDNYLSHDSTFQFGDYITEEDMNTIRTDSLFPNNYLSGPELSQIFSEEIKLKPLTTNDGVVFKDLYGSQESIAKGGFAEFDVYFKTTSDSIDDGYVYDIKLMTQDTTLPDGRVISKTSISSQETLVPLLKPMTTIDASGNVVTHSVGDLVRVYSSNALRFSIESTTDNDKKIEDDNTYVRSATIFELSENRAFDLGSYSTTIASDYADEASYLAAGNTMPYSDAMKLYDCNTSAMNTYYNALKPGSQLNVDNTTRNLSFADKPNTIRSLDDATDVITRVESGKDPKCVTFRFWLEGWDSDCFDGLDKSINVKLSFTSVAID